MISSKMDCRFRAGQTARNDSRLRGHNGLSTCNLDGDREEGLPYQLLPVKPPNSFVNFLRVSAWREPTFRAKWILPHELRGVNNRNTIATRQIEQPDNSGAGARDRLGRTRQVIGRA